ncbi:charged multivesicular body protein 3-like [Xenia sp. Carnegie-2017]|uniref:charged multivesicular body protein 3-like n=1 Tax=Xenia sp. Carnegie-2017 TaxID=2897299 RepID=UPI001F042A5D|nr:charged multivesicular body protein 3-like [Xenia sp. Carnegie-2017]
MGLFGKTPQKTPKEQVQEWSRTLRKESRQLDRQIRSIETEKAKVTRTIKDSAKKGDVESCRILAKEVIRAKKAVSKLYASKAQLGSVEMSMKNQLATVRVSGSLQKSTEVMKNMQELVKLPEIQATMQELSKEMMKAGIIEEMLEDTFESLDDDEMEEEAQEEVDRILFEVTQGALGQAGSVATNELPGEIEGATAMVESDEENDMADMQKRLESLRS